MKNINKTFLFIFLSAILIIVYFIPRVEEGSNVLWAGIAMMFFCMFFLMSCIGRDSR